MAISRARLESVINGQSLKIGVFRVGKKFELPTPLCKTNQKQEFQY